MPWLDGKCFLWYNILNIASAKGSEIQDQGLYMKKILMVISALLIAMLICSGCVIDPMQGKRPVDFPGANGCAIIRISSLRSEKLKSTI